jgi:hypothetical protein
VREAALKAQIQNDVKQLCVAMDNFYAENGYYPETFPPLTQYLGGDTRFEDGLDAGSRFTITLVQNSDGAATDFKLVAAPEVPGVTGSHWYCTDNTCVVADCTTEQQALLAAQGQQQMQQDNLRAAASAAVSLINLGSVDPATIRPYLNNPDNVDGILASLDTDQEGGLSVSEILQPRDPGSEPPDPVALIYNDFLAQVQQNMALGKFDEDLSFLPAVQRSDLTGQADFLFSPAGIRALLPAFVSKPGLLHSMSAKVDAIESAEARGNQKAKAGPLKALINQINAQTGKGLSAADANVLIGLLRAL